MSQENVEAVQAWVAALNREDLGALLKIADPSLEYVSYLASLSGGAGTYRGHDGIRQFLRDLTDAWEWFKVEVDEYRDLGERVLMIGRLRAKGATSGLEVAQGLAWLLDFREGTGPGRFMRVRYFPTTVEALEAAGLSE
jgi:ketosteroid isomerase-like protein